MPEAPPHLDQVKRLSTKLDERVAEHTRLEPYLGGEAPLPPAVTQARLTKVYRYLMPVSDAPWGSLVVDAKLDRLEVSGFRDVVNQKAADRVWADAWQSNGMDAESKLGLGAALLDGRFYASVWPGDDGQPDIALDDMTQMIVEYEEGSRRRRTAALRRWTDDGRVQATLWRRDGLYKYQGPADSANTPTATVEWEKREVEGEEWPLPNPLQIVPVEIRVNPRLKPGRFPYARGEFAHCTGLIDRINLLTFLGLVIAFWMGFPLRGVIGDKIRREVLVDDDGNPLIDAGTGKEKTRAIPPFDVHPDSVFQLENPEAKLAEFKAADRRNLSIYDELQQLAVITKTPRHYLPMEGGISNIATETVNAYEGAMHAAVKSHKASTGEGWEEVNRMCGRVLGVDISPRAEMVWHDHQFRSLAEQADAFVKLTGSGSGNGLPFIAAAELALSASQDQLNRWQTQQAVNPLMQLIAAAQNGAPGGVPTG